MFNKNKKINLNTKLGFTLVETLVAISILTLVLVGTFTAVQKSLSTSMFSRDQINAFYLIQDAMEFIRNKRDINAINSFDSISAGGTAVDWLSGLSDNPADPCYFGKVCRISSFENQVVACSGGVGSCPFLNQNTTTGVMSYLSGAGYSTSKFKREIQFEQINSNEVVVVVSVSWVSGSFSKTITVRQSLFNLH